jgi:Cu/Ag efflux pump CusA
MNSIATRTRSNTKRKLPALSPPHKRIKRNSPNAEVAQRGGVDDTREHVCKADSEKMIELNKSAEQVTKAEEQLKMKTQAATELAEQFKYVKREIGQERDALKQTLDAILADPETPHQARTAFELQTPVSF